MEALLKQTVCDDRLMNAIAAVEKARRSPVDPAQERPLTGEARRALRQIIAADEIMDMQEE